MHTVFNSNKGDIIKIQIEKNPAPDAGLFCLTLYRNGVPCQTFTRDELHRVLDNARDVLLVLADGAGSNYAGEFARGGAR